MPSQEDISKLLLSAWLLLAAFYMIHHDGSMTHTTRSRERKIITLSRKVSSLHTANTSTQAHVHRKHLKNCRWCTEQKPTALSQRPSLAAPAVLRAFTSLKYMAGAARWTKTKYKEETGQESKFCPKIRSSSI